MRDLFFGREFKIKERWSGILLILVLISLILFASYCAAQPDQVEHYIRLALNYWNTLLF